MDIKYMNEDSGRYSLDLAQSGNSDAIHIPDDFGVMTAQLSSVAGGTAEIQYSLSKQADVAGDKAVWHGWSLGDIADASGIAFDSPISYLRVVAGAGVSYRLELLI